MQTKRTAGSKGKPNLGRPATGKRSNPDYRQHSVWLPGKLQADVLKALVTPEGKRFEYSALIEHLLRRWLRDGAKLPKD
jgi:transposase